MKHDGICVNSLEFTLFFTLQKKQKNLAVFVTEANYDDYKKLAEEIREKFLELTRISAKIDGLNTSLNLVVDLINKHIDEFKINIKDF